MTRKPNAEVADDEIPELGKEWFAKSKPASEVLPQLMGSKTAQDLLKPKGDRRIS